METMWQMPIRPIGLDEGLRILELGLCKSRQYMEGAQVISISTEEYMQLYQCTYSLCTQTPDYSRHVYEWYKSSLEQSVSSMVLPSLMNKHGEILLRELSNLWSSYKLMVGSLIKFVHYLDRYFIAKAGVPSLEDVAVYCFYNQAFSVLKDKIRDAVLYLIHRERKGEQVDVHLLKNIMNLLVSTHNYESDVEEAILEHDCFFYTQKVSRWVREYSLPDCIFMIEESLKREDKWLTEFFICSRTRILQSVKDQMMIICESHLNSKQLDGQVSLQSYMAMNDELISRCTNMTLSDSNLGAVDYIDIE